MYTNDPSRRSTPHAIWGERSTEPANLAQGKFPPKPTKTTRNHSLYHPWRDLLLWPISNAAGKAINNKEKKQRIEIFVHWPKEEMKRNLPWSSSDSSLKIWAVTFRSVSCLHVVATSCRVWSVSLVDGSHQPFSAITEQQKYKLKFAVMPPKFFCKPLLSKTWFTPFSVPIHTR